MLRPDTYYLDSGVIELDRLKLQLRLALASASIRGTVTMTDDPQQFDVNLCLVKTPGMPDVSDIHYSLFLILSYSRRRRG